MTEFMIIFLPYICHHNENNKMLEFNISDLSSVHNFIVKTK